MRALQQVIATTDHDYYALLGQKSLKLQNRVADIVRYVRFDQDSAAVSLLPAITYYQAKDGELDKHAPTAFLLGAERDLIVDEQGKFQVSLYKALHFVGIAEAVKAGALNVRHSAQRVFSAGRSHPLCRLSFALTGTAAHAGRTVSRYE